MLFNVQFISALKAFFTDAQEPIFHYIRFLELTFRENTPPFINSAEYQKQLHAYLLKILANKSECFGIINEILQHPQSSLQTNPSPPTTNPFLLPHSPPLPQAQASNLPTPTSSSSSSVIPTTLPQTPATSVPIIKKVTSISSKPLPDSRSEGFRVPAAPIQRNAASAVDQSPDRSVNAREQRNSSESSGSGGPADNATSTPKARSANKPPRTASDLEHQLQEEEEEEEREKQEEGTSMGITLSSNDDAEERHAERASSSPQATPKNSKLIDQLEAYLEVCCYVICLSIL